MAIGASTRAARKREPCRCRANPAIVPSTVETRLATKAMSRELPAASSMASSRDEGAVPVEGEAHPFGIETRVVERIGDDDDQGQVEESIAEHRRGEECVGASLHGRDSSAVRRGRDTHAASAASRSAPPVSTIDSTLPNGQSRVSRNCCLMTLPISASLVPPRMSGIAKMPSAGMNTSAAPAPTPGSDSGKVMRQKRCQVPAPRSWAASSNAGSCFSRLAYSGSTMKGRCTYTRPISTAKELNSGETGAMPKSPVRGVPAAGEGRLGPEDDHPGVDPDEEVAPERQDDQQHQDVAVLGRAARDQQGEGIGEPQAGEGGDGRVADRLQEDLRVDGLDEEALVRFERQLQSAFLHEGSEATELPGHAKRCRDHDEGRDQEEDDEIGERRPAHHEAPEALLPRLPRGRPRRFVSQRGNVRHPGARQPRPGRRSRRTWPGPRPNWRAAPRAAHPRRSRRRTP